MGLTKQQMELLNVAQLSIGEIPKTFSQLHELVWSAFEAGRNYTGIIKSNLLDMYEEAERELDACETEEDQKYWDGYNQALKDLAFRFSIELKTEQVIK